MTATSDVTRHTHLEPLPVPPRKRRTCREQLFCRTCRVLARRGEVTQRSPRIDHRDGLGLDLGGQIAAPGDFGYMHGTCPAKRPHRLGDDADTGSQEHGETGKSGTVGGTVSGTVSGAVSGAVGGTLGGTLGGTVSGAVGSTVGGTVGGTVGSTVVGLRSHQVFLASVVARCFAPAVSIWQP